LSLEQVALHSKGRERHYRLADRADGLGWPSHRRLIIDDSQGLSGAYSFNRSRTASIAPVTSA